MKKLKAKLIVSDFDGTLANSEHTVDEINVKAIKQYVADGGLFCVVTGRMLASIKLELEKLGLKGLVVASQGTVIANLDTGEILRYGGFDCNDAYEIARVLEDNNLFVNAYHNEELITSIPVDNEHMKLYERVTGIHPIRPDVPVSAYILRNNLKCQKVTSLCDAKDKMAIFNMLNETFKGKYDVTYSTDILVEVAPNGDDKGEGLKFLANHYGINIEDTVAMGDNLNDLPMILVAGTGVAVGNATDELKRAADYVTITNDEGAVAEVIKTFGYEN